MKRTISLALSIAVFVCAVFVSGATCSHTYEKTEIDATCVERAHTLSVCSNCGDTIKEYAGVVEYPESEPYFSVEGEREGDVLKVKVVMGNNPGVWATRLTIYYNSEALLLTERANGDVWGGSASVNVGEAPDGSSYVRFYDQSTGLGNNMNNGTVFTATFDIVGAVEDWGVVFKYYSKDVINAASQSISFKIMNTVASGYSEHHFNDGEIVVHPTYTSEGEMLYTCVDCPETKTEAIPSLELIAGDGNMDGKLDARDCFMIKSRLVGALSDSEDVGVLDANEDGTVNAKDLLYLAKMFAEVE